MSSTYTRLPSSHDATPHDLAQEVKLLREEACGYRSSAQTLHRTIADLRQQLDASHESKEVVEDALLGNADRIEALEAQLEAVQSVLRAQLDPRVAAAAVIFKALTGREQPMDRTAEDVIAELQLLVDQSGSEIWEAPPRYVSIQYTVSVHGMLPPDAPHDREALDAWLKGSKVRLEAEPSTDSGLSHVWVRDDCYTGFTVIPPATRI